MIIDFTDFAGKTLTIMNSANGPFPAGPIVPDPAGTAELMQFQVSVTPVTDTSFDPAAAGATLRGGAASNQPAPIVRLADGAGGINPARDPQQKTPTGPPGGSGPRRSSRGSGEQHQIRRSAGRHSVIPIPGSSRVGVNWMTELPQIGSTEEWEIINMTGDAHPIHLHMIQFQVVNRQSYDDTGYTAAYEWPLSPGCGYRRLWPATGLQ